MFFIPWIPFIRDMRSHINTPRLHCYVVKMLHSFPVRKTEPLLLSINEKFLEHILERAITHCAAHRLCILQQGLPPYSL